MSKSKVLFKNLQGFLWVVIFAAIVYLIIRNINVFGNILLVLLGFGAVVIVHEFGHFIVAKLSDIKVEAFSIFMPPTLLGVRKTKDGFKFRILPTLSCKENDDLGQSSATGGGPQATRVGETEYRIGLIPFGGFVKMLGQEDVGPVKSSDDPRSFANKPVSTRIPIIAAGVIFNVISAVIIFMIVFLIGIKLLPPVAGGVVPDSPAARAGLKSGDEIIEIAGKSKDLDFSNILVAAALSGRDEKIPVKIRRRDGSIKEFTLVAEKMPAEQLRIFGIVQPRSLTIAKLSTADAITLLERTKLRPGDRVKSVNGSDVQNYWELEEIVENTLTPEVTLLVQRTNQASETQLVESKIRLELKSVGTVHIYSMVPRFRMEDIQVVKSIWLKITDKTKQLLEKIGLVKQVQPKPFLQSGDIILSIGDVICPTYEEFLDTVKKYDNKELPIKVLRTDPNGIEKQLTINVTPKRDKDVNEARIGISFFRMYDFKHPVVAQTVTLDQTAAKLEIPRGAKISAVNGVPVSNYYDIIKEIQKHVGEKIKIDYLAGQTPGSTILDVPVDKEAIAVKSTFAELIPFEELKRTYKAAGPIEAITMGYRKTIMFIAQTYATLKSLITGLVSLKTAVMGPVGIITFSYRIVAEQPLIYYVYFMGLISAMIAVINFLPLPPFDGGLIVLLLVEKIKGSALSERTQGAIAYAGWVLIGTLLIYVTFNDIVRNFFIP